MSAPTYENGFSDQTLLSQVQNDLLENPNGGTVMTTQQFTVAALTDAVNQAQQDFLRDSGIVVWHSGFEGDSNSGLNTTPGQETVPLPQDCMDVRRTAWIGFDDNNNVNYVQEMPPQDSWASDAENPAWEAATGEQPLMQDQTLPAIPSLYLVSPSSDIGMVDCLYVPVATALSNTGIPLSVPPDFAPAIVWRALYLIMGSQGEGADAQRQKLCQSNYDLYVSLARSLVMTPSIVSLE